MKQRCVFGKNNSNKPHLEKKKTRLMYRETGGRGGGRGGGDGGGGARVPSFWLIFLLFFLVGDAVK